MTMSNDVKWQIHVFGMSSNVNCQIWHVKFVKTHDIDVKCKIWHGCQIFIWKTNDIEIKCQIIISNIKYDIVVKFGATHNNMDVKCEVWYGW